MGYVYIGKGENDESFKIGKTSKLEDVRLKQRRTASPSFSFHIVHESDAYTKIETRLHNYFESRRIQGTTEWFALEPDDLFLAKTIAETYEQNTLPLLSTIEELRNKATSDSYIEADPTVESDYKRLKELKGLRLQLEQEEELIQLRLKSKIGLNAGINGFISWKSKNVSRFDTWTFKSEHNGLYQQYLRSSIRRDFCLL